MAASHASNQSPPDPLMHKNRLQEYAQKSGLHLPIYQTINEGFQHAPKFRATVLVDGVKFISMSTFPHLKEAEQDVAKHALERITKRIDNEVSPLIHQDPLVCKSILHEFAVKMNLDSPKFTTQISKGAQPVFVSSLVFDGKSYTGDVAGSKKMAEQLAARKAIQSLLESHSGNLLNQIIKSKEKRNASLNPARGLGISQEILATAIQPGGSSSQPSNVAVRQHSGDSSQQPSKVVPSDVNCTTVQPSCGAKRRLDLENVENKKIRSHGK